jgi:cystathionine gamma-synthase
MFSSFPYTDTLKVLEKWGPGAHFFGVGHEHDIKELIELLRISRDAGTPIRAVWCEFPSNPLLRSPPLARLRALADEYGFLIAIDDTIGSFDNVDVLPFVDIILTSLSKVFSGTANVLGGRYAEMLSESSAMVLTVTSF